MKKLKIGNITLENPLFLAPMVDVTDLAYRIVCRENGAAITYTEMLHTESLLKGRHKIKTVSKKIKTNYLDKPNGIQITARTENQIKEAIPLLKKLVPSKFSLIDLNCGCPSHLTIDNESGAFLLTNPKKIGKMISILKNENFVVTAKIRLGFKQNNLLELSKEIENANADALTIHTRLASQGRSVPADWNQLKNLRHNISIPLIGNGDIISGKSAEEMLEFTNGVMIARAAIGNPLIFKQILHYLKTGKEKEFDFKENMKQFQKYLSLAKKYDLQSMKRIKYLGSNFIRDREGAAQLRSNFMKLNSFEEITTFVKELSK